MIQPRLQFIQVGDDNLLRCRLGMYLSRIKRIIGLALNRYLAHERNQYAHACKVRYVWAREVVNRTHYQLLILHQPGCLLHGGTIRG